MRKPALAAAIALLAGVAAAPTAAAQSPENANCFGVVSSQRAVAHHDIGQHASEQEEPRLGLGNVTRLILGEDAKMGDFGMFLGEIDGDPLTSCP
jgi:hypothetical protein